MSKTIGVVLALKNKVSPVLKQIGDSIGKTEKEMKQMNSQVQKASRQFGGQFKSACATGAIAIGAVTASSALLINKTVETTSRINDMSARIGVSKQAFQEWDYIMKQNGGDVEALQVGMKKLVGNIVAVNSGNKGAIKNFKALGVSVKDSSGHLKSQEQVFDEVTIALQKMPDGVEKAKLASDLFGKSGVQLMPILSQNSAKIADLKAEYKKLGIAISDEAIEAGDNLGDSFDKLGASVGVLGVSMASGLIPVVQNLTNTLISNMPQIKAVVTPIFQGLGGVLGFVIQNFGSLIAVGSAVVATFASYSVINGVITTIQTLKSVVGACTVAQGLWNAVMLANPVGAVAVAIGVLVGGVVLLWQNWDKVASATAKAVNFMKQAVGLGGGGGAVKSAQTPKPKHNATGTSFSSGGATVVGEFGRELVNMPKGASVTPANKTQKTLGGGGGVTINMPITIQGDMVGNQEFFNKLVEKFSMKLNTAMQAG